MCGKVVWLSQPNDAATGQPQTDKLNADPKLRNRPMIGVGIFLGLRRSNEENKWVGRIYNPDDGNIYEGNVEFIESTHLKVHVCVSIYCHSELWVRSK